MSDQTKKMLLLKLVICVLTLFSTNLCAYAQVGDSCTVKFNGNAGVCKISSECPKVEEQAKRGISPTICGWYQLTIPIVCCEDPTIFSQQTQPNSLDQISYPDEPKPSGPNRPNKRRSEQKCDEYSKSITSTVQAIPLLTETEPININIQKCDYNSVALIVGGKPALIGEFPFMAAIGFLDPDSNEILWNCGGTLISDKYVLTAAHCTFSRDYGDPKVVRLGDLDLTRNDEGSEYKDYNIVRIIAHPKYVPLRNYYDIALLELDSVVQITKTIRPACLQTKRRIDQSKAVATGYGATDYSSENANKLMKVSLNIYDNSLCARAFANEKKLPRGVTDNMLCAGELEGNKDTCQGDSGGPLLVTQTDNQCKFFVIGITSFGRLCGIRNTPAVYTRVSDFVQWIEETIW